MCIGYDMFTKKYQASGKFLTRFFDCALRQKNFSSTLTTASRLSNSTFFDIKVKNYLEQRTVAGKGVVDYLLLSKNNPSASSIILNDNDYLRLANHPEVISQQIAQLNANHQEIVMSAVFLKDNCPQHLLEKKLSGFLNMEGVILTQCGYMANVGVLEATCIKGTPVYIDQFAHASFYDGIKAAQAKAIHFKHNDTHDLESKLIEHGPGVIIVDSIYSSVGSIAPLKEICCIKQKYSSVLVVDESHSLGLYGKEGRGILEELELINQVDFITASLSKGFATRAGIIAGRHTNFIREVSFPAIFSSAVPNYDLARINAMLGVIIAANDRRQKLMHNANFLRNHLLDHGFNIVKTNMPSPIICFVCGSEAITKKFRDRLEERNIFGAVFCSPATRLNESMLRFTVHSNLTQSELAYFIEAVQQVVAEDSVFFQHLYQKKAVNMLTRR